MNLFVLQTLATLNSTIFQTLHRLLIQAESQSQLLDQQLCLRHGLLNGSQTVWNSGDDAIAQTFTQRFNQAFNQAFHQTLVIDALVITNLQDIILFGNQGISSLLQVPVSELLGQSLSSLEVVASTSDLTQEILQVFKQSQRVAGQQTIVLSQQILADLRIFPLEDESGEVFAWAKRMMIREIPTFLRASTVLTGEIEAPKRRLQPEESACLIIDHQGWLQSWHPQWQVIIPSLREITQPVATPIDAIALLSAAIPQFSQSLQRAFQGESGVMESWLVPPATPQITDQLAQHDRCQFSYRPICDGLGMFQGVCIVLTIHDAFKDDFQPESWKSPGGVQASLPAADQPRQKQSQKSVNRPSVVKRPIVTVSNWLQEINRQLMEADSLEMIAPGVLESLRQGFHCDRVLLYQFQDNGSGRAIFEAVAQPSLSLQGHRIQGGHFLRNHQSLTHPQIWMMGDQNSDHFTTRHGNLWQQFQVKAAIAIPLAAPRSFNREITRGKRLLPWGWLVLHQCDESRIWEGEEVDLLCAIGSQLSLFLQQMQLSQQLANSQQQLAVEVEEKTAELQQQVQELQQINRLKDDFLSIVAHELRAPLANMNMAIKMLSLTIPSPSGDGCVKNSSGKVIVQRHQTYLNILQTECKRETDLINDLLDLQKLEANSFPIHPEVVNLNDWLPSVIDPFRTRIQQRNQTLKVEIPEHLSPIFTDSSCLERVLGELLNNACKYTPKDNKIIFQVQENTLNRTTGNIRFILCNQANIPPEELPRIFDKFYRVPHSDVDKQGGTGLGLALVRQLVEQLEATLQVDSQAGWTTFTIDLPCHPSAPQCGNDYERLAG